MTNPRLYMKIHDLCDIYRYFLCELDCNRERFNLYEKFAFGKYKKTLSQVSKHVSFGTFHMFNFMLKKVFCLSGSALFYIFY